MNVAVIASCLPCRAPVLTYGVGTHRERYRFKIFTCTHGVPSYVVPANEIDNHNATKKRSDEEKRERSEKQSGKKKQERRDNGAS